MAQSSISSNPGVPQPEPAPPQPRPAPTPTTEPPANEPPPTPTPTQEEADAIREGRYDATAPAGQRVKKKALEPAASGSGYATR